MIKYIRQDLLKVAPAQGVICHAVNQVGAIGGLNKAICSKFPDNEQAIEKAKGKPLGTVTLFYGQGATVANMVTQAYPGHAAADGDGYEDRRAALIKALVTVSIETESADLYIPYRMCCGLAGDRWQDIYTILENFADSYIGDIYICVPKWAEDRLEQRGILQPVS